MIPRLNLVLSLEHSIDGCAARSVFVALGGASLADERSPSVARADGARRSQTARAWPRAAQH